MKIFFSYGHDQHTEFIQKIRQDLIDIYGLDIWIDNVELRAKSDWERHIEKGIEESDEIVYFLTPHSARRDDGYCLNELAYACVYKKPIIPVMVDYIVPPLSIARIQYLDILNLKDNNDDVKYKEFLENLVSVIKGEKEVIFESDQFNLLNFIDPLDFSYDISKHLKGFIGREWLYKKVDDLLENEESRVLWITAEAGFGKTSFSTYLMHQHKNTIGIHYCKYDNPKRKDPISVLTTLIYQISTQIVEYKNILNSDVYKQKLNQLKKNELDKNTILDELLIQPLNKINLQQNYFFIIDALDEAKEDDTNQLADLIPKFDDFPKWLKIVVTSRPEPYLKRKLSMLKTIEIDAQSEQNLDDLRLFIQRHQNENNCEILKDTNIQSLLIKKSEGNILYLKEVIRSIANGDIEEAEIESLPSGMTGLYVNMFERYFPNVDEYEESVMPVFELLCAANKPLSKDLVADILGIKKREFKKSIGLIGSLIEENENEEIYFYHKSLSDWLVDEDLCSDDYFVDTEDAKKLLAGFLWDKLKETNFNFFDPGKYAEDIFILLPKHLNEIEEDISPNELLESYLDNLAKRVRTQSDILYSFSYMMRKYILLAKEILKWSFSRSKDLEINYTATTRWQNAHVYGLLKLIDKNNQIANDLKNKECSGDPIYYQNLYTNILYDLAEFTYIGSYEKSIIKTVEKLFFEAFYDGRISDIHGALAVLITVLELEHGNNMYEITKITDSISDKIIEEGDWSDWSDKVKSIPDLLEKRLGDGGADKKLY